MPKPVKPDAPSQIEKFKDMAREIGADATEDQFDAVLRRVAKGDPSAIDELADKLGQTDPNKGFAPKRNPHKS